MIFPMNAKEAGKKAEQLLNDDNYIAEVKYDGSRYICDHGKFISRLGKNKTANVPHLHEIFKNHDVILDGEIYYPGGSSMKTTEVMGSLPARAIELQDQQGNIQYMIFDILEYKGKSLIDQPWENRRVELEDYYFNNLSETPDVWLTNFVNNKKALLSRAYEQNWEGIMLKNRYGLYIPNKRPEHNWYKIKRHITYDVVIMDFEAGKGKFKGQIGSIVFGLYDGDNLVPVGKCSGMTDGQRQLMSDHPERYIGRVIEIGAMERTKDGKFRHPQFKMLRDDKDAKKCVMEDNE